jgi:hypothetical protein
LVDRSYYVQNNMLRMDERNLVDGSLTTFDLIPGVIGLRARYGRDTRTPRRSARYFRQ